MRALGALLLLALAVATVGARQMCLAGEASLAPGLAAPWEPWCNDADCTLRWNFSFDTETVGSQRWPIDASINGTALRSLWPALTDVGIQCSTSGELIATTASGPGGERLRLVWTYMGVSSFSCTYMLGAIDTASDFRNFQALLAYSGHIALFDATFSSELPDYSLAAASVVCPVASGTTGGTPAPSAPAACIIGGCRYTPSQWRAHKTSPVWQTVIERKFCSISYSDLIFSRGQAKNMPNHWLQEAQLLVAADMDAALYGCALPVDTNAAIAASYAFLSNTYNCALNPTNRDEVLAALAAWTDGSIACAQSDIDSTPTHTASSKSNTEKAYLTWAITVTVALFVTCIILLLMVVLFRNQLIAYVSGAIPGSSDTAPAAIPMNSRIGAGLWNLWGDDDDDEDEAPPAPAPIGSATAAMDSDHYPLSPMATARPVQPPAASYPPLVYSSYVPGGAPPSPYSSSYH